MKTKCSLSNKFAPKKNFPDNTNATVKILRFVGSMRHGRDYVMFSYLGGRTMGRPIRMVSLAADATEHDPTVYESPASAR
ncbi:hypothetical protein T4B_1157 [Trichinella pseudospiralis]|uniref:Uncharacterized protein n=1 Tax=Trichinella pseudospiralis TaxID=6337 RepID=A0A0V1HRH3_TRIPS|nr:hypothetical protein T4A_12580 [Trichinella pseudospiralis]KRZ13130.1 hypothetical protein T4B_1157 [Trichinella pseudospiralis]